MQQGGPAYVGREIERQVALTFLRVFFYSSVPAHVMARASDASITPGPF